MLTRGNLKLGKGRIWGFALPSGTRASCPGMSTLCRTHCYAVAIERFRVAAAARYRRNLLASRCRDFARRLVAFVITHRIRVVRIHTGGDFYSARYARKWLRVVDQLPRVTFFFYTRAWRVPEIRAAIDTMATRPNCVAWYSCDRDTGVPTDVPAGVRIAWLSASEEDMPPGRIDLVFRVRRLRRSPISPVNSAVCPAEDGVPRTRRATCDVCGRCWRRESTPGRIPLPMIDVPARP